MRKARSRCHRRRPLQRCLERVPQGDASLDYRCVRTPARLSAHEKKKSLELSSQGASLSPLMKKGSISLYSRIFTVACWGGLPCAIARNACSDCATIARARSFLWIEWYLDGMAQCNSGMAEPRTPGV